MHSRCTLAIHLHSALITRALLCRMLSHLWTAESLAIHLLSHHEETPSLSAGCSLSRHEETSSLSTGCSLSHCKKTPLLSTELSCLAVRRLPRYPLDACCLTVRRLPHYMLYYHSVSVRKLPMRRLLVLLWTLVLYSAVSFLETSTLFQTMLSVSFSQRH
jgi:hypothetical protein